MQSPNLARHIDTLAQWIATSDYLVAFTGAGISTDSGIPDYRGPDGVWTRRDKGLPAPQWKTPIDRVRPNAAHGALAELGRLGKLKFLISQNIDNLHRASGVRPEILAELHGNNRLLRCAGCDALFDKGAIGWDDNRWGPAHRNRRPAPGQPPCPDCGGRLVDSVVNFGDPMPPKEMLLADRNARRADLMLVLGSSLVVEPAASLVGVAVRNGAKVVLVNQGETPYDRVATMRLWVGIADVLPPAVERVKALLEGR
jgi:NAD-dependent SIR2 family protein deacetylase